LDPFSGHRLVEIACLEVINCIPTGAFFHVYINPDREVPIEATKIHGLTHEFLKDFPLFDKVHEKFLAFVRDTPLVIHNAEFDLKFLNFELNKALLPSLSNPVVDTLKLARELFPGSPASLDALCRRFKVDASKRTLHGALIDCELLASVYLEMRGGRQRGLELIGQQKPRSEQAILNPSSDLATRYQALSFREARSFQVSAVEKDQHINFIKEKIRKP
jgi:DNA polymerase-3 subunit epsilon